MKIRSRAVRFGLVVALLLGICWVANLIGGAHFDFRGVLADDSVTFAVSEESEEGNGQQDQEAAKEKEEGAAQETKPAEKEQVKEKQPSEKPKEPAKPAESEKPAEPEKRPAAATTPAKHKVGRQLIKIEKSYTVTFQPREAAEIRLDTKTWSTFRVLEAVEHGREVRKGDILAI